MTSRKLAVVVVTALLLVSAFVNTLKFRDEDVPLSRDKLEETQVQKNFLLSEQKQESRHSALIAAIQDLAKLQKHQTVLAPAQTHLPQRPPVKCGQALSDSEKISALGCASEGKYLAMMRAEYPNRSWLVVDVGVNKGYIIGSCLMALGAPSGVMSQTYQQALKFASNRDQSKNHLCGTCDNCHESRSTLGDSSRVSGASFCFASFSIQRKRHIHSWGCFGIKIGYLVAVKQPSLPPECAYCSSTLPRRTKR
jgi:hypothetical protein